MILLTGYIIQDIYYDLDYNIKLTRSEELGFIANLVKTLRILLNIQDDKDFFMLNTLILPPSVHKKT